MGSKKEEAVSPVIGELLMVTVVVILTGAVFIISQSYEERELTAPSFIMAGARDFPAPLTADNADRIAVIRLTSLRGTPYDLSRVSFYVSSDGTNWTQVAHSPSGGPWITGTTVTLIETYEDQFAPGPCYVSMYLSTDGTTAEVYRSRMLYVI